MNARIVVVTDDLESGRIWAGIFFQKGYDVAVTSSAKEAQNSRNEQSTDMFVVDVCGPLRVGLETVRALRAEATIPILLLLNEYSDARCLEVYAAGIDECIAKSIDLRLILAKVKRWLSHSWQLPVEILDPVEIGGFVLDFAQRQVTSTDGGTIKLTNLELRLLHLLVTHAGTVLPTSVIVDRVWGYMGEGDNNLVKNVVYRLRRKVEPDPSSPQHIVAVAGEGYAFYS